MNPADRSPAPRRAALEAAARWRLPFSRRPWRGPAGNWVGAGAGSSLDFQDHRSYAPGDDPRHIHWQAYARTGSLTMKLYRAEVAPAVDVAVDISASMTCTREKQARTDELVAFCVECADRAGASVRVHAVSDRAAQPIAVEDVRADRWRERVGAGSGCRSDSESGNESGKGRRRGGDPAHSAPLSLPLLPHVAWRPGAIKVLISDVLFPDDPRRVIISLAAGSGVGVVLAPALAEEADLPWRGNLELVNCESGEQRRQRIDEPLAARYRAAYARHFELWRDACRRRGVLFGRVACDGGLTAALAHEPFAAGAIEPTA